MSERHNASNANRLNGLCDLGPARFPVAISEISCDGCSAEADCDWSEDCDFLRLKIADRIDINGRVLWHDGKRAAIRFYGQLHPVVIAELAA